MDPEFYGYPGRRIYLCIVKFKKIAETIDFSERLRKKKKKLDTRGI